MIRHQAHQTGSGRTALFSCCSLGPLRVLWGTRGGGHRLPSLLWQWTEHGNCLFNPTFKDTSGNDRRQLLEASNHVLWNRLPDPVEDLFNKGKAFQIYWLRSASVLGSEAWNTMNPMWKKENLCFSFRDLLQPNKCLLLTSLEITQRSLRSCLW